MRREERRWKCSGDMQRRSKARGGEEEKQRGEKKEKNGKEIK